MKYLKKFELVQSIEWQQRRKETQERYKAAMTILKKEEAIDYIINHCSEWLENPVKIIRGIKSEEKYFHSNPVKRFSRDNANYYTTLIDNAPSWKGYPKRGKAFSCSISTLHLGSTGYIVVPEDGAKWGIAPTDDIFQSFRPAIEKIVGYSYWDIDRFFRDLEDSAFKLGIEFSDLDYNEMRDGVRAMQKQSVEKGYTSFLLDKFKESGSKDWWNLIIRTLSPKNSGFQVMTTEELCDASIEGKLNKTNHEIWTDSPCIFIRKDDYFDFFFDLDDEANTDSISILRKQKTSSW